MLSRFDKILLNAKEQKQIRQLTRIFNAAEEPAARAIAHRMAEEIRARRGYSGGPDGSKLRPREETP